MLFQGSHSYHVDDKGRTKLPAEFARGLGATFTITRGTDGCLWLLPDETFQRLLPRLEDRPSLEDPMRDLERYLVGSSQSVALDGQQRLSIPPFLREEAGIEREIVVMGCSWRVEIWARSHWDEYHRGLASRGLKELARQSNPAAAPMPAG